ncbi:MAG: hypothetical protein LUD79_08830 [Oscillospiraceae bacterium]|nr:hypothetical protein [Oscillospiraceae bacterium]
MENAFDFVDHPVDRNIYSKLVELKTEYELGFGVCLQIDDVFANRCTYEIYENADIYKWGYIERRKVSFSAWNQRIRVGVGVMESPTDVIYDQYVTFKIPDSMKHLLPETGLLFPDGMSCAQKDKECICPSCGKTNFIHCGFCPNCGKELGSISAVISSNLCYFDAQGNACEQENAVTCIITEYNAYGILLSSIHGLCRRSRPQNSQPI